MNKYLKYLKLKEKIKELEIELYFIEQELNVKNQELTDISATLKASSFELALINKYQEESDKQTTVFELKIFIPLLSFLSLIIIPLISNFLILLLSILGFDSLCLFILNLYGKKIKRDYVKYREEKANDIKKATEYYNAISEKYHNIQKSLQEKNRRKEDLISLIKEQELTKNILEKELISLLTPLLDMLILSDSSLTESNLTDLKIFLARIKNES